MQAQPATLSGVDRDALLGVIEPVLVAHGVAAVEVTFQRERGGWVLRVTVENPTSAEPGDGITLDLCAEISRDLSHALDVSDVVEHAYNLEVASPGVERPLRTPAEFARFRGKLAKVLLAKPAADGQMVYRGHIAGVEGEQITIDVDGKPQTFAVGDAKQAHLLFELKGAEKPHPKPSAHKHGKKRN